MENIVGLKEFRMNVEKYARTAQAGTPKDPTEEFFRFGSEEIAGQRRCVQGSDNLEDAVSSGIIIIDGIKAGVVLGYRSPKNRFEEERSICY
jgi:hypothetical protein